jgi:hypothetical protein
MTREIRTNPLVSKAGSRPDSKVDSRADNKCNPAKHPLNDQAGCKPGVHVRAQPERRLKHEPI